MRDDVVVLAGGDGLPDGVEDRADAGLGQFRVDIGPAADPLDEHMSSPNRSASSWGANAYARSPSGS